MKYQENDGMKARVWPKGYCDLYFCDKYVIVVKRHHFILNFQSKPIVFGTDIPTKMSGAQKKLIKAKANKVKRGEFHLEFTDKVFQHYKYELNLFGLSAEQIDNLELLSSWVRT